jgi:hypothetical protein
MKQAKLGLLLLLGGLLLYGWAGMPTADAQNKSPSPADCDAYARNYAQRGGAPVLGNAARGAGGGALFGAVIGGGKGAKRGAALGGAVGAVKGGVEKNQRHNQAYEDCMAGRVKW